MSDKLCAISVVGTLIALPLFSWLIKRDERKKKVLQFKQSEQQAAEYMKSAGHAATIAFKISSQKTEWIKSPEAQQWLNGKFEAIKDHVFLDTLIFKEEGITAKIVVKNSQCIVGISYEQGSEAFAQEVARILASNYSMKVAVRNKAEMTSGGDSMLGDQRT